MRSHSSPALKRALSGSFSVRAYLASSQETEAKVLSIVQALEAFALAFDTLTREGVRWLFVPRDLLEVVKREVHEATLDERRYVFAPIPWSPMWQSDGQPTMFYDLATSIGLMFQTEISLTMDGKVPKRLHSKWRPLFYGRARMSAESGEDLYLDQVFEASKEMGLLSAQAPTREEKRRYVPGPKLLQWTESTLIGQGLMLLQWWAKSSSWLDTQPDGKLISSTTARKTLLEHLAHCVAGCWFAVDALLYALWRQAPLYLYDPYRRKLSKPTSLRSLREQWMQREGMMYIGLLGTLAEFGVLFLGSTSVREHREGVVLDLFCLTRLGAALLAQTPSSVADTFPEEGTPSLIVQPNFDVLLLQFQVHLVYQLLPFATLQRIGPVSTFRLTKPALLRGLAHGHRIE